MLGAVAVGLLRRSPGAAPPIALDEAPEELRPRRRWPRLVAAVVLAIALVLLLAIGLAGPRPPRPNLAALVFGVVFAPLLVVGAVAGGDLVTALRPPRSRPSEALPAAPAWAAPLLAAPLVLLRTAARLGGREVAILVLLYVVATTVGRLRCGPGWWRDGDAVAVLVRALARLSPVERHEDGWRRRPWLAGLAAPFGSVERTVLGVVLAGGLARAASWLPVVAGTRSALPAWGAVLLDVGLLLYTVVLLALVDHAIRTATGVRVGAGLVPLVAALLLANDAAGTIYTADLSVTLLSDPFGTGADLFGTAQRRTDLGTLSSPVAWAVQLLLALGGAALAIGVAHRFDRPVEPPSSRAAVWGVAGLGVLTVGLLLAG